MGSGEQLHNVAAAWTRDVPQHQGAVLYSSAGVLVCLADKVKVDCAANAAILHGLRIDPRVDDQTRAGLKAVRLARLETRVQQVEKRRSRLGRRLGGPLLGVCRGHRVDAHAAVVDERHDGGWR